MNRFWFVEDKSVRPPVLFRDLIIFDKELEYGSIRRNYYHLTVYKKDKTIVAVVHEAPGPDRRSQTIGEGAASIWPAVKSQYNKEFDFIAVQGHNGVYEYVNIYRMYETSSDIWNSPLNIVIAYTPEYNVTWSPAGTLEEVLERHLK